MAQEIGISRTPFKQALVRLSDAQLVDIIPSKGFCLDQFSEADILSIFEMSIVIESFCAQNLWRIHDTKAGKTAIAKMHAICTIMEADESANVKAYVKRDIEFHKTLVDSCDNHLFSKTYDTYCIWISIFCNSCLLARKVQATDEHVAILNAIETGTVDDCLSAVTNHLTRSESSSMQSFTNTTNSSL